MPGEPLLWKETRKRSAAPWRVGVAWLTVLFLGLALSPMAYTAPPPIGSSAVVLTPTPNPVDPNQRVDLRAESPVANTDISSSTIEQIIDRTKMRLTGIDDITAPDGWTIYTSTDGGATYTAVPANPASVTWSQVNAVKATGPVKSNGATPEGDQVSKSTGTGQPTSPIPASIDTSGAGDGYQAFFDPGHTRLFNIPHHELPSTATVDCHLLTDGSRCAGFPYKLGVAADDVALGRVVGTKLWTVGTRQKPGQADPKVGQMAFRCIDLSDVLATGGNPKDCSTPFVVVDDSIAGASFTPNVNFDTYYNDPTYGWQYPRGFTSGIAGAGFQGSATETKLWSYNVLAGLLTCVNTQTMTPCQAPGTDGWPIGLTPTNNVSLYSSQTGKGDQAILESQGRVYLKAFIGGSGAWSVLEQQFKLVCVLASDPTQKCPGFSTPLGAAAGILGGKLVELPAADGSTRGVCLLGAAVRCFDAAGSPFFGPPTLVNSSYGSNNAPSWGGPNGWISYPVRLGNRIYFTDGDGGRLYDANGNPTNNTWTPDGAKLFCWDAARAATASTPDAAGCMGPSLTPQSAWSMPQLNPNLTFANYTMVPDPVLTDCLWIVRDAQPSIYSLNARTGKSGDCGALPQEFTFASSPIVPRMGCEIDPNAPAIRRWQSFTLVSPTKTGTTPPNYAGATVTIRNEAGTPIPGWTDVPIAAGVPLSLMSLPVAITGQKPSFLVKFIDPSIKLANPVGEVQAVGDSPQLCLKPVAVNDCPPSPPGPYTPAKLVPVTAPVTAKGSSTQTGGAVTTFTDALANVAINPLPLERCAATISGVAEETTGLKRDVPGVTVTLLTSAGAPVTYPSDWPVAALRGQPVTATTDANGAYAFPPVGFGAYTVRFGEPTGYTVVSATTIANSQAGTNPGTVNAAPADTSVTSRAIAVGPNAQGVGVPGVVNAAYLVPVTAEPDRTIGGMNQVQTSSVLANDGPSTGSTWSANPVKLCDAGETPLPGGSGCTKSTVNVPGEGTYTVTGSGATTKIQFTPCTKAGSPACPPGTPDFIGAATPQVYQATDAATVSASSTYSPVVLPPPAAVDDTTSGPWNTPQTANPLANDTVGSIGTVSSPLVTTSVKICPSDTSVSPPSTGPPCTGTAPVTTADGTYTVNPATGAITFTPSATFTGLVTEPLQYTVSDTLGQSSSALYSPVVIPPPGPSATPQIKPVERGATIAFTTLTGTGGLATPGGPPLVPAQTCLIVPGSNPAICDADGVITIPGEGTYTLTKSTGIVTFAADPNAPAGTLTPISYQVTDTLGVTANSTLTPLTPRPPAVENDLSTGPWDTEQIIKVLANDTATTAPIDPSSVTLCGAGETPPSGCTRTTLTVAGEGTYTVNPDGTVTFDPVPTFEGTATAVRYSVADVDGRRSAATITPAVTPPGDPVAEDATVPVAPGYPAEFPPLTGAGGLSSVSGPPLVPAQTCLIVPGSSPAACDADGVVTIAGEGTYRLVAGLVTFTLAPGFPQGTPLTPIEYRVVDTLGHTALGTLTPFSPDPPVALDDTSTGEQGSTQTASVLGNDTPDSNAPLDPTTVKICAIGTDPCTGTTDIVIPGEGTYSVNPATGLVTFTPLPGFTGNGTGISYTVTDILGRSDSATYTPTVLPKPAPIPQPNAMSGPYGAPLTFTPLADDSPGTVPAPVVDPDGVVTSYSDLTLNGSTILLCGPGETPPTCTQTEVATVDGTYVLDQAAGTVVFTGAPSFTGTATQPVTYQVANAYTKTTTTPATTTDPLNPAIAKINDAAGKAPGAPGYVDTWPLPPGGTSNTNSVVNVAGTPQVASTTITPTITPPFAETAPDTRTTPWNTAVTVDVLDNDTFVGVRGATSATLKLCGDAETPPACTRNTVTIPGVGMYELVIEGGVQQVRFAPLPGFTGTAPAVPYSFTDVSGTALHSTVQVSVDPPIGPTASPETKEVLPGASVAFSPLTGVGGLAVRGDNPLASACLLVPGSSSCDADGIVTIAGQGTYVLDPSTGITTFTPVPGATGTLAPVEYRVTDTFGMTATSTLTPVIPAKPSLAPMAGLDLVNTLQTFDVLAGATHDPSTTIDPSSVLLCGPGQTPAQECNQTSVVAKVGGNTVGTYTVDPSTGEVVFEPVAGFTGTAPSVYVAIADGLGQRAFATITPTVTPLPNPVAEDQTLVGALGEVLTFTAPPAAAPIVPGTPTPASITNLAIDPSSVKLCGAGELPLPDGMGCAQSTVTTIDGTYTVQPDGSVQFAPAFGFSGTAVSPVTYQVANQFDVDGTPTATPGYASALLTPRVDVVPTPTPTPGPTPGPTPAPVLVDDAYGTPVNTPVSGSLAANDTVPAGSVFTLLRPPLRGTAVVQPNGSFTYTPARGFTGDDTFTYQVCTPGGQCGSAQVQVTVTGPDALAARPVATPVPAGSTKPISFAPPMKTPIESIQIAKLGSNGWGNRVNVPGKGLWVLNGKKVAFTPAKGFVGRTTIRYRVVDRQGRVGFSTFTAQATVVPTTVAAGV